MAPSSTTNRRSDLAAIEVKLAEPCGKDAALRVLRVILGAYPGQQARDPEVYHAHMIGLLTGYPTFVVEELANPRTGVMTKHPFLPSLSDVRQAAEAMMRPAYEAARMLRVEIEQIEDPGKPPCPDAERERVEAVMASFHDRMRNAGQSLAAGGVEERRREAFCRTQDTSHDAIKGSTIYQEAVERMAKDAAA